MSSYSDKTSKSRKLFQRANKVLPAGVSYGIRALPPYPFYVDHAKGVGLVDVDGNTYTDYWVGHGALILGHAPDPILKAVKKQLPEGTHFGFSHKKEIELAEKIVRYVPSAEMVRYTSSGTEANMYGTRLARAYTGRDKMLKIEGGWHGGYDSLHAYVSRPYGRSESAGLNPKVIEDTLAVPFNDLEAASKILKNNEVACIVLEPVMGAAGFITPEPGYLEGLRELCDETDTLLIFDEVITGFRLGMGGAQEYYGVKPDLTIMGKVIGGGFPVGAFCGPEEIMELIDHNKYPDPEERSAHGGTFTGNPISMVAGSVTVDTLKDGQIHKHINELGEKMRNGLQEIFDESKYPASVTGVGSTFAIHFQDKLPKNSGDTARNNLEMTRSYFKYMLDRNIVFLSPTVSHSWISSPHTEEIIEEYLSATVGFMKDYKP
ncbi:aminotransferase class III-fold pyridoxal phosphate-dependent enzyme [Candidatus Bathyarchaeota archaeon]|nr:aminotransferase class III-fold pyridoxal phosphate-dependent enzyme [Candidatus Bathyarchaeota archaeon]